jgi:hypothetical protein
MVSHMGITWFVGERDLSIGGRVPNRNVEGTSMMWQVITQLSKGGRTSLASSRGKIEGCISSYTFQRRMFTHFIFRQTLCYVPNFLDSLGLKCQDMSLTRVWLLEIWTMP